MYNNHMRAKTKDKWKVSFGRVKSQAIDTPFKAVIKENPYIKGARYRALPGQKMIGTNSEIY